MTADPAGKKPATDVVPVRPGGISGALFDAAWVLFSLVRLLVWVAPVALLAGVGWLLIDMGHVFWSIVVFSVGVPVIVVFRSGLVSRDICRL